VLELFWALLVIGASGFGMAMIETIRTTVVKRDWLSEEGVDEGLGVVQLYPGPMLVDLVALVGYRLGRIRGALAAAVGFLSPSLVLVLGLSWAYFRYGSSPATRDLAIGLDGLVVGVLASVTMDLGTKHARSRLGALLALGAFAVGLGGANVLWAVLGAFMVGALMLRDKAKNEPAPNTLGKQSLRALALACVPGIVVVGGVVLAALASGALAAVSADMAKAGSVAFGNGAAILPVLQQDVLAHHWMTSRQFEVGVAIGQITPGPVLTTAAFVGFAVAGWWGGLVGGIAVFAPSIAMTMIVGEVYPFLRRLRWLRGAIAGLLASFTGLMANMVLTLGRPILSVPAALGLAAAAFVAVRVYRMHTLVVFAAGLAVWGAYLATGGPR
jgi:chromate transporter